MERRDYYLVDIIKLICAILVVGSYCGPMLSINETLNYFLFQILSKIAFPFFFVASSYFFFSKLEFVIGLKSKENIKLLRKYILRLCILYIIWTLFYLIPLSIQIATDEIVDYTFVDFIRNFFFAGSYYHLWVLPAMIFSTILVYLLLMKFQIFQVLEIGFGLYIIGMIINIYGIALIKIPFIGDLIKVYLDIFASAKNGLFFGTIYTAIGFYIATSNFRLSKADLFKRSMICFLFVFIEGFFLKGLKLDQIDGIMYITLIPFIFYFFLYILTFNINFSERFLTFRTCSTLIYFLFPVFIVILNALPYTYVEWVLGSLIYFVLVLILTVNSAYVLYKASKQKQFRFLKVLF